MARNQKPPSRRGVADRRTAKPRAARIALASERLDVPRVRPELVQRSDAAKHLTKAELRAALKKYDMVPKDDTKTGDVHVELSPAVPYVAGGGWLNAVGVLQTWFAQTTIGFIPDQPHTEQGQLEIWMDGLKPGHAYVANIRVGGWAADYGTSGTFNVGASDANHVSISNQPPSQVLSVFMPGVAMEMSLITINTQGMGGWLFDDVQVIYVGQL